jgi:hypothetical protein
VVRTGRLLAAERLPMNDGWRRERPFVGAFPALGECRFMAVQRSPGRSALSSRLLKFDSATSRAGGSCLFFEQTTHFLHKI